MLNKRPLVCFTDTDGKFVVLGGNMRLKAAKDLGLKELPIILADEWTEEQKAEFLIKDNVGFGEWDWNELNNDWDTEQLEVWGLEVPKFKVEAESEIDDLSDKINSLYRIEIVCKDEEEQEKSYNKLIEQGYECRLLTL
jgi:ParB-like chromosome segregation protein Spo0J